jgi:hypothetical protein
MGNCCAAKRDPNEKTTLETKNQKVDPKKISPNSNNQTAANTAQGI